MFRRPFDILLAALFSYLVATIVSDLYVDRCARNVLDIELETHQGGSWQLFWSRDGQFTQDNSITTPIADPGTHTLSFPLTDDKIRYLRLDPTDGTNDGTITFAIHSIKLSNGFGTIYEKSNTEDIAPMNSSISRLDSNRFSITGLDPQLKLDFIYLLVKSNRESRNLELWVLRILVFLFCALITLGCMKLINFRRWGEELSNVVTRSGRLLPLLVLGGIIASNYGFINGFPLIFSDTGMYLKSGMEWFVPKNRPIMYGIFTVFTSLKSSLWIPIIVQGAFITYCCYLLLENILGDRSDLRKLTLLLMLILSLFTSLSWFSSQLSPDILCTIAPLTLLILFIDKSRYVSRKLALVAIFLICNLSHTSSLLISLGLSGFALVVTILYRKRFELKRAAFLCALSALSFPLMMTLNYTISGKFTTGENSYIFMSAKLADLGLLQKYLRDNPDGKGYQLATMVDDIEQDSNRFIWNKESVIHKLPRGKLKAELTEINHNILSDGPSLVTIGWKGLQRSIKMFIQGTLMYRLHSYEGKYVHDIIGKYYPDAEPAFLNSMQQRWTISDKLNVITNTTILCLSYISVPVLLLIFWKRLPPALSFSCIYLFFSVGLNDYICATLSTSASRYHVRISWVVVVALFCLLLKLLELRTTKKLSIER